jgi:hypothetical protein
MPGWQESKLRHDSPVSVAFLWNIGSSERATFKPDS